MRLSLWVDKACQGRDCWKTRWRQAEDGPRLSPRPLVFAGHHRVTGIKVQHQGPCDTDLPWALQTRRAGVERQEVSGSYPMWCVLWLGCLPRLQGRGCGLQFTLERWGIIGGLQRNDCDPPVTKQSWFFSIILASVLVMSFSLPKCPSLDSKLCATSYGFSRFQAWNPIALCWLSPCFLSQLWSLQLFHLKPVYPTNESVPDT